MKASPNGLTGLNRNQGSKGRCVTALILASSTFFLPKFVGRKVSHLVSPLPPNTKALRKVLAEAMRQLTKKSNSDKYRRKSEIMPYETFGVIKFKL